MTGPEEQDRGAVTVEVELSRALLELIDGVNSEGDSLEDWIAGAAEMETRRRLWENKTAVPVPVPEDVQDRAELLMEHWESHYGSELVYADALTEVARLEYSED